MVQRPTPPGPMAPGASPAGVVSAKLQQVWTGRGIAAWALWPVSVVYGFAVALRQMAYQWGIFKSKRVAVPVLVVGNVVAGGAGKTPVVMMLAAHLGARGVAVGVVSRGYGRQKQDCREVLSNSCTADVGDEPKLVKQATGVPVFVAPKRYAAAIALLANYPYTQLIICDDGLQHLALKRDLEICVFDDRGLGNGLLLPAGPLREPWPRQADFVLHSGESPFAEGGFQARRQLSLFAKDIQGHHISLAELAKKPLAAVAAIAQPERFFAMLREQGLKLAHTVALPDHFDFAGWTPPFGGGIQVVCTEKDAVKLWPQHPEILAVPLELVADPAFLTALDLAVSRLLKH